VAWSWLGGAKRGGRRRGGNGHVEHVEGRAGFIPSSEWVKASLGHCFVGTEPGSEAILELCVISEILMETAVLWVVFFPCPKERKD